jgi:uncharacterized protein
MPSPSPYVPGQKHIIPARGGAACSLKAGQKFTVINTHATQVIDFWAFEYPEKSNELVTYLSNSHTRASNCQLSPIAPCTLYNTQRAPLLKFLVDTSGGVHDTLMAACDIHRYHELGVPKDQYHENCADNLRNALARDTPEYVLPPPFNTPLSPAPEPLNLFMNIPLKYRKPALHETNSSAGGVLSFDPAISPEGGKVVFEALKDCIVAMSACPQDILKINHLAPVECHFIVE